MAAVIVGDDSYPAAPPMQQVTDLRCPARLCQTKAVQQNDGMFGSPGRPVVADRQPHAVTGDNRALDVVVAPRLQSPSTCRCVGETATARGGQRRRRKIRDGGRSRFWLSEHVGPLSVSMSRSSRHLVALEATKWQRP